MLICGVGGAHVDHTARLLSGHRSGASNPAVFRQSVGGAAFNGLRAARLILQGPCALLSVHGGDGLDDPVLGAIDEAGIANWSGIYLDHASPAYLAITQAGGGLITAAADMAVYEARLDKQINRCIHQKRLALADAVICDANVPEAGLERLCAAAEAPIHAIGTSPAKVVRFLPVLGQLATLFVNAAEARVLTGLDDAQQAAQALHHDHGVRQVVVTDGGASVHACGEGRLQQLAVPAALPGGDVTGCGDALAGATVAGFALGDLSLADGVIQGIAAASLALTVQGPLNAGNWPGAPAWQAALARARDCQHSTVKAHP